MLDFIIVKNDGSFWNPVLIEVDFANTEDEARQLAYKKEIKSGVKHLIGYRERLGKNERIKGW